jgi:hypothetical protein
MSKGKGLGKLLIQPQATRNRLADLGNFERVGKAGPVIISLMIDENLGLVLKTPESGRVDNSVSVAFESGPIVSKLLTVSPPERLGTLGGIAGKIRTLD